MQKSESSIRQWGWLSLLTLVFMVSCFKERPSETPAPSDQGIEKSFFLNPDGKPKTFIAGGAPVEARSIGNEFFLRGVNDSEHLNIEFEIFENAIVGRIVNPSRINDRAKWIEWVRIPIIKHYYFEKDKDQYGREKNNWIENERSHWSARPMMKLDLSRIEFPDLMGGHASISSIRDIEWDKKSGFLGFTASARFSAFGLNFAQVQADYRINFLHFQHQENFKKVPYHPQDSKLFNILHVMGRKYVGEDGRSYVPEYYAARWDFTKGPKKLYITGAPKDVAPILVDVVERWNTTFRKLGITQGDQKAFEPIVQDLKYPFDLRYTTIVWSDDREISMTAPLGIGQALADVRNGEILWGSVLLWGGYIRDYINRYTPLTSNAAVPTSFRGFSYDSRILPFPEVGYDSDQFVSQAQRGLLASHLDTNQEISVVNTQRAIESIKSQLAKKQLSNEEREKMFSQLSDLVSKSQSQQHMSGRLNQLIQQDLSKLSTDWKRALETERKSGGIAGRLNLVDLKSQAMASENTSADSALLGHSKGAMSVPMSLNIQQVAKSFHTGSVVMEKEMTLENLGPQWSLGARLSGRSYQEMFETVITDLTLHEVGHMVNLGHQFKENILPAENTVPSQIYKTLVSKADKEHGFTNFTSVMGYKSGKTEMVESRDELMPGPHDELVLKYIYLGQYSTYDPKKDAFTFQSVPFDGIIPEFNDAGLKTTYFPACNDMDASLQADPFCNRWDRGSKAEDIVADYFSNVNDTLVSDLYALNGSRPNEFYSFYRLWVRSESTASRVRLFYNEMRRRLQSERRLQPLWEQLRKSERDLMDFSKVCRGGLEGASRLLEEIFSHKDILDLCRANALAMDQLASWANKPQADHSKIDRDVRYSGPGYLGGDADSNDGYWFGGWSELSNFPLKLNSILTMTTTNPLLRWGRYLYINPYYDSPEDSVLYRTLYPQDYTKFLANSIRSNLNFPSLSDSKDTIMGKSALAISWLLPNQEFSSNEAKRLPSRFNRLLQKQSEFRLSMAAVLIDAVIPDSSLGLKVDRYQIFRSEVYDFFSSTKTPSKLYLLPDGEVFVHASKMFLYPISKITFYDSNKAYVIAFVLTYDVDPNDELAKNNVKFALEQLHEQIVNSCVLGYEKSGLKGFFSSGDNFEGFYIPPGIESEQGQEKTRKFYQSIDDAFKIYEEKMADRLPPWANKSMINVCQEAKRGVGQIMAAGGLLSGIWLPFTIDYLEK